MKLRYSAIDEKSGLKLESNVKYSPGHFNGGVFLMFVPALADAIATLPDQQQPDFLDQVRDTIQRSDSEKYLAQFQEQADNFLAILRLEAQERKVE